MRASIVVCLSACLALSACGNSDSNLKSEGENAVQSVLKDPDSAEFSDEFIVRTAPDSNGLQTVSVCGLVNSKNSFGAYTGPERFVVNFIAVGSDGAINEPPFVYLDEGDLTEAYATPETPQPTNFEALYWNKSCVDDRHPATFSAASN
jgi:hypothetical protein